MTANAGKGANGRSGKRSTAAGDEDDQPKKTSAASKPPGDEVTVRQADGKKTDGTESDGAETDGTGDGADPADKADKAEDTVVDLAVKKKTGAEDTVRDIKLPDRLKKPEKTATDPTGGAAGSKDRLVAGGPAGTAKELPKGGDTSTSSGRTASMDSSASSPGSAGGTPRSYGRGQTAALEPAPRPNDKRKPERATARKTPRKAHLQVARFDPWSVMKFSFIMSLVCFLVLFVAVAVLYLILSGLGVFDALSDTIRDLQGKSNGGLNPASWFSAARILGYTALIGTLNVLLITALATVWSVIYNMAADLVGGVEVTLKEADQ